MCWTTFKKENLQKKTAKQDIKVVKILFKDEDGSFVSPYRMTEYRANEVICSKIGNPIESLKHDMWGINEGLHSYSTKIRFVADIDSFTIDIMPANDALNFLDYWRPSSQAVIFEGVIPNGSEYYENEYGELVSDRLKVVSVIAEIDRTLVSSSDKIQELNERIHNLLGACIIFIKR